MCVELRKGVGVGVGVEWEWSGERDIGAERVKSERRKEGHEREMCVRTGVHERLSCTISQRC